MYAIHYDISEDRSSCSSSAYQGEPYYVGDSMHHESLSIFRNITEQKDWVRTERAQENHAFEPGMTIEGRTKFQQQCARNVLVNPSVKHNQHTWDTESNLLEAETGKLPHLWTENSDLMGL
ncbi:hypothetical protein HPP92_011755 [Vanilla planifolia]|uniref:Uncharacterized protein n=1 Tax=Vanilla planifolia TaxID=51239 RepID=A0A835V5B5_VANPL|nr:hypothetical protein HPP92_011755 [Vanilla planifolia]